MAGTSDFIRSWLTLPVVFVLVNIVIGTIAVTSAWWKSKNPNANGRPSVLTRLMSGGFSRKTLSVDDDLAWNSFQRQDSLVQKPPDHAEPREEQDLLGDEQEAPDHGDRPDIDRWTSTRAGQKPLEDIQEVPDRDELPSPAAGMEPLTLTRRALHAPRLGKSKSDSPTTGSGELLPPPPPPGVKKSGSFDSIFSETGFSSLDSGVPRKGEAVKAEDGASAAEVDAEAEDFIQRFKNQLKLQRLQSILRYREMIDRGK